MGSIATFGQLKGKLAIFVLARSTDGSFRLFALLAETGATEMFLRQDIRLYGELFEQLFQLPVGSSNLVEGLAFDLPRRRRVAELKLQTAQLVLCSLRLFRACSYYAGRLHAGARQLKCVLSDPTCRGQGSYLIRLRNISELYGVEFARGRYRRLVFRLMKFC